MIGPFCYKNISTNEEMKKNLQKQNIIYICLIILGIITFIISFFTKDYMKDFMRGFLDGASTGLVFAGILLLYKNKRIMNNEQKLTERRIEISDERNRFISEQASKFSLIVILIELYIILLVSVFINLDTLTVCICIINSFILFYILSFRYFSGKL